MLQRARKLDLEGELKQIGEKDYLREYELETSP